jgi:hypothetical protein
MVFFTIVLSLLFGSIIAVTEVTAPAPSQNQTAEVGLPKINVQQATPR